MTGHGGFDYYSFVAGCMKSYNKKFGIRERMAVIDEHTWNPPLAYPAKPVSAADRVGYSPEIEGGRLEMRDVLQPIYEEASEATGKKFEYPAK